MYYTIKITGHFEFNGCDFEPGDIINIDATEISHMLEMDVDEMLEKYGNGEELYPDFFNAAGFDIEIID